METGQLCLRKGEEQDLLRGGAWVYDNEIAWVDEYCLDGGVVDILDSRERFIARGYFNSKSRIAARVLTRDPAEAIDAAFFRRRLQEAWDFRRRLGFENACRVVFGESDGLPGLTVDKFGPCLSMQITAAGMETWRQQILDALVEIFSPMGIYERGDLAVREKEGLPLRDQCVYGTVPQELEIREHDARMLVCIPDGQKTGHFLDQQENRGRLKPYCQGAEVLDLCCCTGGFSIHAGLYGASHVRAVDVSQDALDLVRRNAALNGLTQIETACENVFDLAAREAKEGRTYDLIICDPPAFAKSRKALENAYRGYKELNRLCIQMLRPGGILFTFSCSQFMTPELFARMLTEAAGDTGRTVRLLEQLIQSRDHPADLAQEHSLYLKGLVAEVR